MFLKFSFHLKKQIARQFAYLASFWQTNK